MKSLKYITLFFLSCSSLFAQPGSVYSRFGLGDLAASYSARYRGLGDAGSAILDANYLSPRNPASWSSLEITRIEIGANYQGVGISTNNESAFYSTLKFSGFSIGFPLQRDYGLTLAAGVLPYSRVNYETAVAADPKAAETDPANYNAAFKGQGGITKGFIGLSYSMPRIANFGLSMNYLMGNIDFNSSLDFVYSRYSDFDYNTNYTFNGISATIGVISTDLAKVFDIKSVSDLRVSLVYDLGGNFDGDSTLTLSSYFAATDISKGDMKVKIPGQLTIGTSVKLDKRYLIVADFMHQPWSDYKLNERTSGAMRDLNRYSVAVEYTNPDLRERDFLKTIGLRLGFSYEQTQYKIGGKGIDQMSATAGFSVPIDFDNTLDMAFLVGKRGTKDDGLMQEYIYGMNFSLSLGEPWFRRGR
ncbi:MAG: hypothetical protein ACM3SM_06095 [Bacteroidota bacterium]